jgi:hypothetical protein
MSKKEMSQAEKIKWDSFGLHQWGDTMLDNRMHCDICGALMTLDPDDDANEPDGELGVWTFEA